MDFAGGNGSAGDNEEEKYALFFKQACTFPGGNY